MSSRTHRDKTPHRDYPEIGGGFLERALTQEAARPISETIRDIWAGMPDEVRSRLPRDGAAQVDHYVYGLPKKDQ
jgi:hypothetical protein